MSRCFLPHLALVVLLASWPRLVLSAQREPTLERGAEIEIVSERLPGGIGVGWLVTLTRDTLTYIDTIAVTSVALEDIGQLRVNVGRDGGSINAATVLGGMVGALVGMMSKPKSHECISSLASEADCGEEIPSELVGAVLGAGVFRLFARFTSEERWVNVNLDRLLYRPPNEPR